MNDDDERLVEEFRQAILIESDSFCPALKFDISKWWRLAELAERGLKEKKLAEGRESNR